MADVISLGEHRAKQESLFKLESAMRDFQHYTDVVNKSVMNFDSYSAMEKYELYKTLAEFNVEILANLIEYKKGELV